MQRTPTMSGGALHWIPKKEPPRKLRHKRSITIAPHLAPYLALAHNSGA